MFYMASIFIFVSITQRMWITHNYFNSTSEQVMYPWGTEDDPEWTCSQKFNSTL